MDTTLAPAGPPPVRARVPRGAFRAVMALFVFVLSLSVVFATPDNAQAYKETIEKPVIREVVKVAGTRFVGRAAAGAVCGPACLGVSTAVALGMVAYDTRDLWWPWVFPDQANGATNRTSSAYGACAITVKVTGNTATAVTGTYSSSGCHFASVATVYLSNIVCSNGSAVAGTKGSGSLGQAAAINTTWTVNPGCSVAGALKSFDYRGEQNYSTNTSGSGTMHQTGAWPAASNTQTTDVTCRNMTSPDPANPVKQTISDTDVGHPERYAVPSCSKLGSNWFPEKTTIKAGPDSANQVVQAEVLPDANFFTDYADCFVNGVMTCVVRVWVGGIKCEVGRTVCTDWDNYRLDNPDVAVECKWGSHVVPIGDCQALKKAYDTRTGGQTIEVADPVTGTVTSTSPVTGKNTDPYTPPATASNGFPGAGTNPTAPATSPDASVDANGKGCFGETWSWNPVDFILTPVKCAFLWAFVPKTSLSSRVDTIKTTLNGKAPFSWIFGLTGLSVAIPGGVCPDWTVHIGYRGDPDPGQVNGPAMTYEKNVVCGNSYTDAIRTARPVLLVFMVSLALWPLIRSTAYAAFPVIKPQPGVLR